MHDTVLYICIYFANIGVGFGCYSIVLATAYLTHFRTRIGLASAFVSTGLSCGTFLWSPVLESLLRTYGWTGGILINGALHLHGLVLAMLIWPKDSTTSQNQDKGTNQSHNSDVKQEAPLLDKDKFKLSMQFKMTSNTVHKTVPVVRSLSSSDVFDYSCSQNTIFSKSKSISNISNSE